MNLIDDRTDFDDVSAEMAENIDEACDRFEQQWKTGISPRIEDFLNDVEQAQREVLLQELVRVELAYLHKSGRPIVIEELLVRFPSLNADWLGRAIQRAKPKRETLTGVLGDFQLQYEIGRGGMGVVYAALQVSLNRRVAVKVLPSSAMSDSRQLRRFQNESRAAAALHHPHIVPVFAVGADRGVNYFAMQLIEGQTLSQRIKSSGSSELSRTIVSRTSGDASAISQSATTGSAAPTLPPNPATVTIDEYRTIARQGMQIAEALEHAHSLGVVHRDVKPSNLMLDRAGKMWVTDFGLARIANDLSMTMTGDVLGTLRYMSPEQALAKHGLVDHRTDIYSLGVTLYEWLTLRPAIDGKDRGEILHKIAFEEPLEPRRINPQIPLDLETILLKSIAKEPHLRYQSAEELADDLRRFADDQPIKARRQTRWQTFVRWQRRNRALSAALAITLAVIVVANGLITWKWREERLARTNADLSEQSAKRSERLAREAEQQARQAEQQATQRADELQRSVYLQQIARSEQEWWSNNVGRAEQLLDRCPPELRQWEWGYLKRLCRSEVRSFAAHDGPMIAAAIAPDGQKIAAGGSSGTVHLWDIASGTEQKLLGHSAPVASIAFSADGRRMVSTATHWSQKIPGEVKVWNVATGGELTNFPITTGLNVTDAVFSPDGRRLATALWNSTVQLVDLETNDSRVLNGYGTSVKTVVFTPDGQTVYAAGWSGKIMAWNVSTGKITKTLLGHTGDVVRLAMHPNGKQLASASWDHTIRVWDLDQPTDSKPRVLSEHTGVVNDVTYSPDGRQLASASEDGAVGLWETRTWKSTVMLRGHDGSVRRVSFSPGGKSLASTGLDGQLKLWDLTRSQLGAVASGPGEQQHKLAFRADGARFYVASQPRLARGTEGFVSAHDPVTGKQLSVIGRRPSGYRTVAVDPAGKFLAADVDDNIQLWDASTEKPLRELKGHSSHVAALAVLPAGVVISGADDGSVKLWQAESGELLHDLNPHVGPITLIAAEPRENYFATAGNKGQLSVWKLTADGPVEQSTLRRDVGDEIRSLACSSHDQTLAVGRANGTIQLWNLSTGAERPTLRGHTDAVVALDFSPDGRRLASGGHEGAAVLWDTQSGQEALILRRQFRELSGIAFSPDGQKLAAIASHAGREIRVWDSAQQSTDELSTKLNAWRLAEVAGTESLRRWPVAITHLNAMIESSEQDASLWKRRGNARAELEQWTEALADFTRECALNPTDLDAEYRRAAACLGTNNLDEHQRLIAELFAKYRNTSKPYIASPMLYAVSVSPNPPGERDELLRVAQLATGAFRGNQRLLGAFQYRVGDAAAALKSFEQAAADTRPPRGWDRCFLVLCEHQLGHRDIAAKHLESCDTWIDSAERAWRENVPSAPVRWYHWQERVETLRLRQETESVLKQ